MITKVLNGLIVLTSVILVVANMILQAYLIAGITVMLGAVWLILQMKDKEAPHSFFFVFFLGLTILGSLNKFPIPFMLLALSTNLAVWDLSRFRERVKYEEESTSKTLLELKHLQNLAITLSIGFFVALFPTFIHISLNFVVFLFILLLLMLSFRTSILYIRKEADIKH